jgi:hypothetical protein
MAIRSREWQSSLTELTGNKNRITYVDGVTLKMYIRAEIVTASQAELT